MKVANKEPEQDKNELIILKMLQENIYFGLPLYSLPMPLFYAAQKLINEEKIYLSEQNGCSILYEKKRKRGRPKQNTQMVLNPEYSSYQDNNNEMTTEEFLNQLDDSNINFAALKDEEE